MGHYSLIISFFKFITLAFSKILLNPELIIYFLNRRILSLKINIGLRTKLDLNSVLKKKQKFIATNVSTSIESFSILYQI